MVTWKGVAFVIPGVLWILCFLTLAWPQQPLPSPVPNPVPSACEIEVTTQYQQLLMSRILQQDPQTLGMSWSQKLAVILKQLRTTQSQFVDEVQFGFQLRQQKADLQDQIRQLTEANTKLTSDLTQQQHEVDSLKQAASPATAK